VARRSGRACASVAVGSFHAGESRPLLFEIVVCRNTSFPAFFEAAVAFAGNSRFDDRSALLRAREAFVAAGRRKGLRGSIASGRAECTRIRRKSCGGCMHRKGPR